MSNPYREHMQAKLKSMLKPEQRKILCVGDPLPELAQLCQDEGREYVHLEQFNADWRNLSREQPDLALELPVRHFDLLVVYHALEQALDPERVVLELRKYVQPQGQIYLVAYNIGHISTILNLLTQGWEYQEDGALRESHIRYFSNESLRHLLDQVGFEFIDEVVYQLQQVPVLTRQLSQIMKNPYLNILSFIMIGRKVNAFPFIDFENDAEKKPPAKAKAREAGGV